jgi:hypothetical protein
MAYYFDCNAGVAKPIDDVSRLHCYREEWTRGAAYGKEFPTASNADAFGRQLNHDPSSNSAMWQAK